MLEKQIQKNVVAYAKAEHKMLPVKFSTGGRFGSNGWPDYQFFGLDGHTFFIEFKAPGAKPSALQAQRIDELRERGFRVYVIDNPANGREAVDTEVGVHG